MPKKVAPTKRQTIQLGRYARRGARLPSGAATTLVMFCLLWARPLAAVGMQQDKNEVHDTAGPVYTSYTIALSTHVFDKGRRDTVSVFISQGDTLVTTVVSTKGDSSGWVWRADSDAPTVLKFPDPVDTVPITACSRLSVRIEKRGSPKLWVFGWVITGHTSSGEDRVVSRSTYSHHLGGATTALVEAANCPCTTVRGHKNTAGRAGNDFNGNRYAAPIPANSTLEANDQEGWILLSEPNSCVPATALRIGGYARIGGIYTSRVGVSEDLFSPSTIPIGGAPHARVEAETRESRLNLGVRRPAKNGPVYMFFEFDFFDSTSPNVPHLRHAYAQATDPIFGGRLVLGQTYSTFMDISAFPNTVDFAGPNSAAFLLVPMAQYSLTLGGTGSPWTAGASLAKPFSDITLPDTAATRAQPAPDAALQVRYGKENQGWHLQASYLWHEVGYILGGRETNAHGGGVQLSTAFSIFKRDTLLLDGLAGRGIAHYVNDLSGGGLDAIRDASGVFRTLPEYGGYVGVEHYWSPHWSTQVTMGLLKVGTMAGELPSQFVKSAYASVNVIYQREQAWGLGGEVLWGRHREVDGGQADVFRLQLDVSYFIFDNGTRANTTP